jgi:hypothetical protein
MDTNFVEKSSQDTNQSKDNFPSLRNFTVLKRIIIIFSNISNPYPPWTNKNDFNYFSLKVTFVLLGRNSISSFRYRFKWKHSIFPKVNPPLSHDTSKHRNACNISKQACKIANEVVFFSRKGEGNSHGNFWCLKCLPKQWNLPRNRTFSCGCQINLPTGKPHDYLLKLQPPILFSILIKLFV